MGTDGVRRKKSKQCKKEDHCLKDKKCIYLLFFTLTATVSESLNPLSSVMVSLKTYLPSTNLEMCRTGLSASFNSRLAGPL